MTTRWLPSSAGIAIPTDAAARLVDLANANGGVDNITIVLVDVVDDDDRAVVASEKLAAEPPPKRPEPERLSERDGPGERDAQLRDIASEAQDLPVERLRRATTSIRPCKTCPRAA